MALKGKRTAIEDIRRVDLVQAAHRVFIEHGLGGMTTTRICHEAGMSPGILAYYFKGKEEVLFAMVCYNNRILMEDVVARLHRAKSRWERLLAIVEGNFPSHAFERNTAKAWLSVCAAAGSDPKYGRLQNIFYRRLNSNLASVMACVLSPERLGQAVLGIGVMIDGLWLRKAAGNDVARSVAVDLVVAYVKSFLTPEEVATLRVEQARTQNPPSISGAAGFGVGIS